MLSVLSAEMEAIRASQSKKMEKKRKPSATVTSLDGVPKKPKTAEDYD